MADQAGPFAGLTPQDQKLIMGAFKSLKNGFEVSLFCVRLQDVADHDGFVAAKLLCSFAARLLR